jgi:hypothetical protein
MGTNTCENFLDEAPPIRSNHYILGARNPEHFSRYGRRHKKNVAGL